MRVLFVCSGNNGISPIIQAQAASLIESGVEVDIKPIIGRGISGYLRSLPGLHKCIRSYKPDVVHAHYSFCGIAASLAITKPVVTSLMGSDVKGSGIMRLIIRWFIRHNWKATIVKSQDMKRCLGNLLVQVIPNGVDLTVFMPLDKKECRTSLGWDPAKKHVLFLAKQASQRPEKNLQLAIEAINQLNDEDIELHIISDISHFDVPLYLNASDLLLLTSQWEGSPNVVKEAMACNVKVVSTNVGDIGWLFGDEKGLFLSDHSSAGIQNQISACLSYQHGIDTRKRIVQLGLGSLDIASRLVEIYAQALDN